MGLHIVGHYSGKDIDWNYHTIHWVRTLAIASCLRKDEGKTAKEIWEKAQELESFGSWDRFSEYWQLLHFADNEGYLLSGSYLDDVDYSKSFYLGSLDRLYMELLTLKEEITSNREPYETYGVAKDVFWKLLKLVDAEQNEGGHITFS